MRTIKFRGKIEDNGKWVYGNLTNSYTDTFPLDESIEITVNICIQEFPLDYNKSRLTIVIPETVGQFTGLTDKNGKEIYFNDLCKDAEGRILIVGWSDRFASFVLESKKWAFKHWFGESCEPENIEVIGNIHDNPELLQN